MDANQMFHRFNLLYEGGKLFNRTFNTREVSSLLNFAQEEILKERYAAWKNAPQLGYGANEVREAELSGLLSGSARINRAQFIQGTADNGALPGPDRDLSSNLSFTPASDDEITYDDDAVFGVFVPIPDEAVYVTYQFASITNATGDVIHNVPVMDVTRAEYYKGIYDFYANPYNDLVWALDWGVYTTATWDAGTGAFIESTKSNTLDGTGNNMTGANASPVNPASINHNTRRSKYVIPGKDWTLLEYRFDHLRLPPSIVVNLVNPSAAVNCLLADFLHEEVVQKAVKIAAASIMPEPNKYQVNKAEDKANE